jgi:hypothetical protein
MEFGNIFFFLLLSKCIGMVGTFLFFLFVGPPYRGRWIRVIVSHKEHPIQWDDFWMLHHDFFFPPVCNFALKAPTSANTNELAWTGFISQAFMRKYILEIQTQYSP